MISLQRSMHSSQMYTPAPAISFLTCFWLFPQNEHLSRSPPSPMRATPFVSLARSALGLLDVTCRLPRLTSPYVRESDDSAQSGTPLSRPWSAPTGRPS